MTRKPAVAGRFYPGTRDALAEAVDRLLKHGEDADRNLRTAPIRGVVVPHAGYRYSGPTAGRTFAAAARAGSLPNRFLILSPNHTGRGPAASIYPAGGSWRTPLGDAQIDTELTEALLAELPSLLEADVAAHEQEHGVEVELPFLQRLQPSFTFAAIVLRTRRPGQMASLGAAIARVLARAAAGGRPVLPVASTDMNHFASHEETLRKDGLALERLEALDPEGLLRVCSQHDISMCGVGPTAATLHALAPAGLARARLLEHCTSGDRDGSRARVVGYAGLLLEGAPT
ncbi:MAG: AmmeMemoRadiSam system protein B [Planctomycetota bacterium]|jgi:AmmeMemoRadiSam system protein B